MIEQREMMKVVEKLRGDAIVLPTMTGNAGWLDVTQNQNRDVSIGGAMGKASSFALGLAMAQPDTNVIVFDGDGSLEMNLGTLATIAGKKPKNLYHFVIENGVYGTTGGQPIPSAGALSFAGMAREAGYNAAYEFDDLEEFTLQADSILNEEGPVFVCIKIVPEVQNEPIGRRTRHPKARPTKDALIALRKEIGTS
jgi:phosphonopyruvate decarboxylase